MEEIHGSLQRSLFKPTFFNPPVGDLVGYGTARLAWPSSKALTEKHLLPPYLPFDRNLLHTAA